jgi:plastocyanin
MRTLQIMTRRGPWLAWLAAFGLALAALSGVQQVQAGPANTATVKFGNPNSSSGNSNAANKMIPGSVVVTLSGSDEATVNFERVGFHQVAIYNPGVKPNDLEIVGGNRVNDPTDRFFRGVAANGGTETVTFTEPGRYLVICDITSHFNQNMWGWAIVKGD